MDFFNIVIKRVANFSIQSYNLNKNDCFKFFNENTLFQLSILTSSLSLFDDLKKNKSKKVAPALRNYFSRAHFNPTPFGLFSSVGILQWDDNTAVKKTKKIQLSVKYDNLALAANQNLQAANGLFNLLYSLNPSVYDLGNGKIAFYNSKNAANDKIEMCYVELDCDDHLQWLIESFKNRKPMQAIAEELVLEGFDEGEVYTYLQEIWETGLIIEDVNFDPYSAKLRDLDHLIRFSSSILVNKGGHTLNDEKEVHNFSEQYLKEHLLLFQNNNDLRNTHSINSFEPESGSIDGNIKKLLKKYIDFTIAYNSHTAPITDSVSKFIAAVSGRYNDGFVSFNEVFNPYSGIKYTSFKSDYKLKFDDQVIYKIISSNPADIKLNLPVSENVEQKKSKLPATFSILIEILECRKTGREIVYVKNLLCGSALNLISRFGEVSEKLCNEIVCYEKSLASGKLIADINCIGNLRSINLAPEKQLFDHCIPINTSTSRSTNPILTSDLLFHLSDGEIKLVSKEYQKQILPKKVSSINPKLSDSEMYQFLCDFEMYNEEIYGVNFDFNSYEYLMPYVSRIYLEEDLLLHPAQLLLIDKNFNFEEFKLYLNDCISSYNFTAKLSFMDRKGGIIIDAGSDADLNILYNQLKKRRYFYVSECIYDSFKPKVLADKEEFAHELVVSIKNDFYKSELVDYNEILKKTGAAKSDSVSSDWLYLEVFCNSYGDSEILQKINDGILFQNKCDQFFFIHYNTSDRHLRLRFKTAADKNKMEILKVIESLKEHNYIYAYSIKAYQPEVFRYGGRDLMSIAETIFDADTRDYLNNVLPAAADNEQLFARAVLKIVNYFKLFDLTLDQMIDFCDISVENYKAEFKFTSELRKDFNAGYDLIKPFFETIGSSDFLAVDNLSMQIKSNLPGAGISMHYYGWLLIHMSMNRHFPEQQRLNEFKSYYYAAKYLNKTKYSSKKIFSNLEC